MSPSRSKVLRRARVRVAGPDKKGIISTVTTYLFQKDINIEDIDQRILEGVLVMNMLVDLTECPLTLTALKAGLQKTGERIGMEITLKPEEVKKIKDVALLVTAEPHCIERLLRDMKSGKIRGRPAVILSNRSDLKPVATRFGVPFHFYPSDVRRQHEAFLLEQLSKFEIDLIVLARYMQILSPEFCFRNEGKIINIHPSLLPSFPGARAYSQAFHKGVEVVGVTAHFATTDLDQGPIIAQGAFSIHKSRDTVESIAMRGKKLEAEVLARAVKLFCEDRLTIRRGKVIDSRSAHDFDQKMKEFYT